MSKKKSRKEYITGYNQWTSTGDIKYGEDVRNELLDFSEKELDEAIDRLSVQPGFYEKNVKGQLVDGEPDPGNYCDDCREGKPHSWMLQDGVNVQVHKHSTLTRDEISPCVAAGDLFGAKDDCQGEDPERCVLQEHLHGLPPNTPPRHCRRCRLPENKPPFPYAGPLCMCGPDADIEPPPKPPVLKNTGYADLDLFLDDCFKTMREKGHDYRQGNDADLLHNFRTVADTVGVDMMKVWFTYFYKHYSAMATFIKEGGQSESEPIEGRIKDQIVYLLLFYRMVQEKKAPVMHHPV